MIRRTGALIFVLLISSPTLARADLTQLSGWPKKMAAGITGKYLLAPFEGVALVDLVEKGNKTLEVVGSSSDRVFVWDLSGKALPGWPATVNGTAQAPPSVGDIDGDGDLEVVQVARYLKYSDPSYVHAFHHDGKAVKGWPVKLSNLSFFAVTLADLDGNGALDVIVQVGTHPPGGSVLVLSGDGKLLGAGWNHLPMGAYPGGPAAAGDLDGDGKLEVVYHTADKLTVRRSDGSLLAPFPISAPSGKRFRGGVLLVDLDSAKGKEIVCGQTGTGSGASDASLLAYTAAGKAVAGFPSLLATGALGIGVPTAGDIDGDGKLELVANVRGKGLVVVGADGKVQGKVIATKADSQASVQLVDLDGDGKLELLADNNSTDKPGLGYLEAYEADGTAVVGFPLRPKGTTMNSGPSVADLDGDGRLELAVVTTTLGTSPESYANLWTLPKSKAAKGQWPTFCFDARRSGCPGCAAATTKPWKADGAILDKGVDAGAPDSAGADLFAADTLTPDAGAPDASGDGAEPPGENGDGCTCAVPADARPDAALPLLLLLGLALLRRRR